MEVIKLTLSGGEAVTLTAYLLDSSKELSNMDMRPAMLVLPGGGYNMCSDREAEPVAMAFAAHGYNTFVLRYSVGKGNAKFPRPLLDAQEALQTIYTNAEKWHTDKNRVAVIGFSAGGHLAAALSTMGSVRPAACVLGYPCILESIGEVLAEPVPSLEKCVDSSTPPTFIFASSEDSCVPIANSLEFARALDNAGVPFEMHIFEKGNHGFSLAIPAVYSNADGRKYNAHLAVWLEMCVKWLATRFFAE